MPASYTIDEPLSLVFSRCWGTLTDSELADHARALGAAPRFNPLYSQIADFRDVEVLKVTADGVRNMVHLNPFSPKARRVIVVGSEAAYGLARIYQTMLEAGDGGVLISRTLEEAIQWLGLDPATTWPAHEADALFGIP